MKQTHKIKLETVKGATFSDCRTWRYTLTRSWDTTKGVITFIGLNPSTADETEDDPTIRRCINYAMYWGYGGMIMLNLFAYRATAPKDMKTAPDPIGPDNDKIITSINRVIKPTVACWGNHGTYMNRDQAIMRLIPDLSCLRTTKNGNPMHPLYLERNLLPIPLKRSNKIKNER